MHFFKNIIEQNVHFFNILFADLLHKFTYLFFAMYQSIKVDTKNIIFKFLFLKVDIDSGAIIVRCQKKRNGMTKGHTVSHFEEIGKVLL